MLHVISNSFTQCLCKLAMELYEQRRPSTKNTKPWFSNSILPSFFWIVFSYKWKIHNHCLIVYNNMCLLTFMAVSFVICVSYTLISTKGILKLLGGMNWYEKVFFLWGGWVISLKVWIISKQQRYLFWGKIKEEKDWGKPEISKRSTK